MIDLVDDISAGGPTDAEIDDRFSAIQFPSDWGVLGDSYARLQGHFSSGDQVGAADETFHLYDLCVDYLAGL